MSRRFLSTAMAAAGLGAVSLLICAPGAAMADNGPPKHDAEKGHIYTVPKGVKAGHKFKVILKCEHPVERPWVSSKVTGKVWLKPVLDNVDGMNAEDEEGPEDSENGAAPRDEAPEQPNGGPAEQPNGGPAEQPNGGIAGQDDYDKGKDDKGKDEYGEDGYGEDGYGEDEYGKGEARHPVKYWAWAKAPRNTPAGHYTLKGACQGHGILALLPNGAVAGGDGGAGTDASRTATGAGMLGAAAVGGFLLLRRRRTDGSLA